MRTTLDLDETVLAAARAKARQDHTSLGRAVSDLALRGLGPEQGTASTGFPTSQAAPGHLVADDLVATDRDDG